MPTRRSPVKCLPGSARRSARVIPAALAFLCLVFGAAIATAQPPLQAGAPAGRSLAAPIAGTAAVFGVSPRMSDTPDPGEPGKPPLARASMDPASDAARLVGPELLQPGDGIDGALQATQPAASIAAPVMSFDGVSNADNQSVTFGLYTPPDPVGDVGPNHYVQAVNFVVRVFNKSTGASLKRFDARSLFSYPCSSTVLYGGIVQYDQLADRWVIGHFSTDPTTQTGAPYHICLAVSQTPDPTGAYNRYDFVIPNTEAPALPQFGVWPDGYYLSVHQFVNNTTTEDGNGAYAFDRTKMLAGDASAGMVYFNLHPPNYPAAFPLLAPTDLDGVVLPPAGRSSARQVFQPSVIVHSAVGAGDAASRGSAAPDGAERASGLSMVKGQSRGVARVLSIGHLIQAGNAV